MDIKTYRAKTMRDALELVRRELGPSAAVLHTREVNGGALSRLVFGRQFEVAASAAVNVPSRLPEEMQEVPGAGGRAPEQTFSVGRAAEPNTRIFGVAADADTSSETRFDDYRARYREDFRRQVAGQLDELHAMVEKLCDHAASAPAHDLPEALFHVFTSLIEAEVDEAIARSWIDELREDNEAQYLDDASLVMGRVAELLEGDISVSGALKTEANKCRVVALVGPTGVGKTTTIAKLAANYRLREKRRVGLITVDTYRVAAVEQLRSVCRHYRPADGSGGHAARDARGGCANESPRLGVDGYGGPQPARRGKNSRTEVNAWRSGTGRGSPGAEQHGRREKSDIHGGAVCRRRHDGTIADEAR